jgi:hypothetical protein
MEPYKRAPIRILNYGVTETQNRMGNRLAVSKEVIQVLSNTH